MTDHNVLDTSPLLGSLILAGRLTYDDKYKKIGEKHLEPIKGRVVNPAVQLCNA